MQSPLGGTKVAWGGQPGAAKVARSNQRFLLATVGADLRTEIDRLVSLGATLIAVDEDGSAELTDPDGKEFCLRPA